ncbi:NrfD/PsrC family molybdoenzyme membrane anchor subunit [Adlercreutzia sp. ZJ138]|uniref:NrfD/PsrC family molybdoenzyme membrane anchor subunit n=1 Tax=Adlercreutzia sp. ZJ138 TaxID=2709405 RepID=UPI0013ED171F|nr:NrfD/PsrC family molybdoenzyme membrane anchor subunit [Adlercreutzia sp. ZJ138]
MAELQTVWGWLPAIYLFLAGLSAGTFLAVTVLRFAVPDRFNRTVTYGSWAALAFLAVGLLALLAETEKPFQALIMFTSFVNFSSWMTIGAWLLLVASVLFLVNAILVTPRLVQNAGTSAKTAGKVVAIIGAVAAVCVALYSAVLLGAAPSVPLWQTWTLPLLFLASAVDTGLALTLMVLLFDKDKTDNPKVVALFERAICVAVVVEALVLAAFVLTSLSSDVTSAYSASILTSGAMSVPFWAGVVIIGLAIPLVISAIAAATSGKDTKLPVAASVAGGACSLVGGLALRYVVLAAGTHAAIIAPLAFEAMLGIQLML